MRKLLLTFALLVPLAVGCGSEGKQAESLLQGAETVKLDPAEFTTEIDNPYWPMAPGDKWVYREGEQRVEVTVTNRTKVIDGIEARVVHDLVTVDGEPKFYARGVGLVLAIGLAGGSDREELLSYTRGR